MERAPSKLAHSLAISAFLAGVAAVAGGIYIDVRYLTYVGACASLMPILYVIYIVSEEETFLNPGRRFLKTVDVSIFLLIVSLAALTRSAPSVPDLFYWIVVFLAVLLVYRCFAVPTWMAVGQILLAAIVLRAGIWFSAPTIGHDPRKHVGITRYFVETGGILRSPAFYYRDFPASHALSATTELITEMGVPQSYFVAIAVTATLSIVAVIAYTRRLVDDADWRRPTVLVALFISLSPAHVVRTSLPIPQSLNLVLLAPALLLVFSPRDKRIKGIVLAFLGVLAVTHNSSVLVFTLLFGVLFASDRVFELFKRRFRNHSDRVIAASVPFLVICVGSIITIEYLHQVDYLHTHVNRILSVFFFGVENAETDIAGATFGAEAYTLGDPVLHIGVGYFITAIGLGFAILLMVYEYTSEQSPSRVTVWTLAAVPLFGLIGIGMIRAGTGRITRVFPEFLLIIAPVIGIGFEKLGRRRAGIVVVGFLIVSAPALAAVAAEEGHRNPMMSPTNRAPDDYPLHMDFTEERAMDFAIEHGDEFVSGSYVTGSSQFKKIPDGPIGVRKSIPRNNATAPDFRECGATVMYRSSYVDYPGANKPLEMHTVYDIGDASLLRCGT